MLSRGPVVRNLVGQVWGEPCGSGVSPFLMWGEACSVPELVLPGGARRQQPPLSPGDAGGLSSLASPVCGGAGDLAGREQALQGCDLVGERGHRPPQWPGGGGLVSIRGCFVPCSTEEELPSQR